MRPFEAFRADVDAMVQAALAAAGHTGPAPALESPPDPAMGDLGLPCFAFAKTLRKAPPAIASDLAAKMAPHGWVAKVAAAGPYVNFTCDKARLAAAVLADPQSVLAPKPNGDKVLLEHTSANPNGPLHVGRARNPIVGDTLARIHRAAGADVEVQYYMDNLGRQVATLSWGAWNIPESELPPAARDKVDHKLVRFYQAAHDKAKNDPATAEKIKHLVEELESADAKLLAKVRPVYESCFAGMRESLTRLGAHYDSVKDESDVVLDGSVAKTIEALKKLPIAGVEPDGANYLDLSSVLKGQKDKFFFTRKDGTSVYATRDIAYHAWKAKHVGAVVPAAPSATGANVVQGPSGGVAKPGRLLNVLGEDHRLQALQVGVALDALGIAKPTVVFYSFVSLPEGKMSTRANRVVFVDDLLDQAADFALEEVQKRRAGELGQAEMEAIAEAVGVAAVRFNIARIQPEKPIEFRWEEALSFDGDSAPYLMYAHARAASLLAKAQDAGLAMPAVRPAPGTSGQKAPAMATAQAGEEKLLHTIAMYPEAVADAARQNAPHRLCSYAIQLAGAFNEYYRDHRVLECEDPVQQQLRLRTVAAAAAALKTTLTTLGIPALDAM